MFRSVEENGFKVAGIGRRVGFGLWDFKMMRDEIVIDEKRMRAEFEKMDAAFCTAMLNAISTGTEHSPEGICKEPGTRRPIVFLAD